MVTVTSYVKSETFPVTSDIYGIMKCGHAITGDNVRRDVVSGPNYH